MHDCDVLLIQIALFQNGLASDNAYSDRPFKLLKDDRGVRVNLSQLRNYNSDAVWLQLIPQVEAKSLAGNLKLPEGGFDWEAPLWAVGSMVATYFGVNIRRDMFRSARGEPTGKAPAAAQS